MVYIKDDEFIRGKTPMTKEEIRILSIAKLNIKDNDSLLDIGAGTGSISIQMSKSADNVNVTAVEKNEEAVSLILKNKEKFNADNVSVIKGDALEVKDSIDEKFHGIFIGGSSGDIEEIIEEYSKKLKEQGTIVMNFITVDNLYKASEKLRKLHYETECCQVQISRQRDKTYMFLANNPVYILSAKR